MRDLPGTPAVGPSRCRRQTCSPSPMSSSCWTAWPCSSRYAGAGREIVTFEILEGAHELIHAIRGRFDGRITDEEARAAGHGATTRGGRG